MNLHQKVLVQVAMKTNSRCFYCNKPATEIDHFISKSKWHEWELDSTPVKGRLNHPENLFLACERCNRSKSNSCPEDFMKNPYLAWDRYFRANRRIGYGGGKYESHAIWGLNK